jgi:short-subunit dehydrogenase
MGSCTQVLINCAGTSIAGAFEELPIEAFEKMMRVNYLGSVYPTRVVLPSMKERRSGAIVFVSSQAGQVTTAGRRRMRWRVTWEGAGQEDMLGGRPEGPSVY